ncbi:MAG: hypothetical protein DRN68_06955 [Thaumarchaeota archaeon]|nr:MAG: hypothetical protein DRN68_06955 [Nitrososphaerota archaeon]
MLLPIPAMDSLACEAAPRGHSEQKTDRYLRTSGVGQAPRHISVWQQAILVFPTEQAIFQRTILKDRG